MTHVVFLLFSLVA